MNDQLNLWLRREGLGQNDRSRWFWSPLKELSDLSVSWTILHVVIITIDKTRVLRFALIPIVNRCSFGSLCLRSIFVLILTPSLFRFLFTVWGRLNCFYLRSLFGGRGRRRSILNIRSRFGVGGVPIGGSVPIGGCAPIGICIPKGIFPLRGG
jgi:hypothetical protein